MRYIVLGASAAGINGAKELRKCNPDAEILMIAKDQQVYSRCILHHYVSGNRDEEGICFVEKDFFTRYRIDFIRGTACVSLDGEKKTVTLEDGQEMTFDKLLIATGASSFLPPIEGLDENLNQAGDVFGFRNLADAKKIKELAAQKKHIVVLGGGLVGVDVLAGLLHMGKQPVLVELAGHLLSKQLDKRAAATYEEAFTRKGAAFLFGKGLQRVVSDAQGALQEVVLQDGTTLPCDMLIVTIGVKANIEFLKNSKIETDRQGLVIDVHGQTSHPDIYGAGDVTGRSPIWPNAVKEGIIAARAMSGRESEMKDFFASKATMNFEGIPSMSLGLPDAADDSFRTEIWEEGKSYKKIIEKEGKIYGAILQGDLSYAGILTQLISHKIDVSRVKKPIFSIDYSDFFHLKDNFEFYYEGEE